jgi:hypothetical protein
MVCVLLLLLLMNFLSAAFIPLQFVIKTLAWMGYTTCAGVNGQFGKWLIPDNL